jgi:hypothetical protein
MAPFLAEAGFIAGALGMQAILHRRQLEVASRELGVVNRQSPGARRASKSSVSSPFAARNFETGNPGGPGSSDENS